LAPDRQASDDAQDVIAVISYRHRVRYERMVDKSTLTAEDRADRGLLLQSD